MKKVAALILILFLAAYGSKYSLHEDFETDLEQVLPMLDKAYEENRELNEEEKKLHDKFYNKYRNGQFLVDNEAYEMNDLEKEVTASVSTLKWFTEHEEALASEENVYEVSRNNIEEYIDKKEIPEELVGKHPTYELYSGVHPKINKDAQKIIDTFDSLINGSSVDVSPTEVALLDTFISNYGEFEFEIDEKFYLMNDEGNEILFMVEYLKEDITNGGLSTLTKDMFNDVKEMIKQ